MTLQIVETNMENNETDPEEISKHQVPKFLSCHPMTDYLLAMEEGKVVNDFQHSILHSKAKSHLNWPSFLIIPELFMKWMVSIIN
jgi:hypothetical protein